MKIDALLRIAPILSGLRIYHKHTVVGKNHIPERGAAIVAVNHSLASYDIALLMAAIYEYVNRVPRSLIDRLFYKIPGLGPIMESFGSAEGNHGNAVKLLEAGELLVLAPGGMRESLRPSTERYKVIWDNRKGFIRLAIETSTPIILAACPSADDLYDVFPSHVTAWAYKTLKVPLFFAKGLGYSPLPKPARLTHYLSEPIVPPVRLRHLEDQKRQVEDFHTKVCARMDELMAHAAACDKASGRV